MHQNLMVMFLLVFQQADMPVPKGKLEEILIGNPMLACLQQEG
jgi:hypothetical protein